MPTIMEDDSVSSAVEEVNERKDAFSADDLAWADSCLVIDPDVSESKLDNLKDALLEILNFDSEFSHASLKTDGLQDISAEKGDSDYFKMTVDDATSSDSDDEDQDSENHDTQFSKSFLENAFLPTYKGERMEFPFPEPEDDVILPKESSEAEDEIFKVWDLGITHGDDEAGLLKDLKKALSENSLKSNSDDPIVKKIVGEGSLDDLINGIADLSLEQNIK